MVGAAIVGRLTKTRRGNSTGGLISQAFGFSKFVVWAGARRHARNDGF